MFIREVDNRVIVKVNVKGNLFIDWLNCQSSHGGMNRLILNFTNPLLKLFLFVFFLIPLMLSSQEDKKMKFSTERYKSDWEKVSVDETKGLPKSALENFTPLSS